MPQKKRLPDLKTLLLGSKKMESGSYARYPNGTQKLAPVTDIEKGVIRTEDNRNVKLLEVLPCNFHLKSAMEQLNIIHYLASYLKISPSFLQILVRTQRADIDAYCKQMERHYEMEINENCREMIYEDAQLVNYMAEHETVTHKFYMSFPYQGSAQDFEAIAGELADQAETAYQYLDYCNLEVLRHEDYDNFLLKTLYTILNKKQARHRDLDALAGMFSPVYGEPGYTGEWTEEEEAGRMSLQDLLSPNECDLTSKKYVLIDGVYHAYFFVAGYGYPTQVGLAWLSPLIEMGDGVSISFFLERKNKEEMLPKVSKTTMINRSRMRDVGETRTDFEELDDAIDSGMYIKNQMNRENEDFYYMHTLIEVIADDEETLEKRMSGVENLCKSMNLMIRRADYRHEACYRSMLPLAQLDPEVAKLSRRNVLTFGAAAAFPFSSYELCDETGILLGINLHNNSAIILDQYNTERYINGNLAMFGASGAGKTYTLLLIAMRLRMHGVKVYCIAPEKGFEYRWACEAIGGQYLKISPGSDDSINIMEIRKVTLDIDSNLREGSPRNDSVLLEKVQSVHTYLSLHYPNMTPEESYQLDTAILECYKGFGITKDNSSLLKEDGSFRDMPDLTHLYPVLLQYPSLKSVALVVKKLMEFGFGRQTNIDVHSSFVVLDTSSAKKEDVSACTYLATSFIRDELTSSRTRKVAVFTDELWKIAGEEGNEQAADFALELIKTVRGYGGVFISATQNIIDYFALRGGKFGESLLNNSHLKLLLKMEEAEALKLQEKLGLSDEETMQLIRCNRGQGLLCAGKTRIPVEIRASQKEHDLITTNRADLEKRKAGVSDEHE